MRPIKFRAWDGERMFTFDNHAYDLIYNDICGWNIAPNKPDYKGKWTAGQSSESAERFALMQFTGIQAKGTDLYEGDLVKAKKGNTGLGEFNDVYEVQYSEKFCQYVLMCVQSENDYRVGKLAEKANNQPFLLSNVTEIIGNKFETPIAPAKK